MVKQVLILKIISVQICIISLFSLPSVRRDIANDSHFTLLILCFCIVIIKVSVEEVQLLKHLFICF